MAKHAVDEYYKKARQEQLLMVKNDEQKEPLLNPSEKESDSESGSESEEESDKEQNKKGNFK